MTDPKDLWPKALDCLRTMSGVQGVAAGWQDDGSTALAVVDKQGVVYHKETDKNVCRAVVINDIADLADQITSLVTDFRVHLATADLPGNAYIRGDGINDPTIFSSPLVIDGVPARIMALNYRIRGRWMVTLDTFTRKPLTVKRRKGTP